MTKPQTKRGHTELPWSYNNTLVKTDGIIEVFVCKDENGEDPIADILCLGAETGTKRTSEEANANAKFIVTACNNHYELLSITEDALAWQEEYYRNSGDVEAVEVMDRLKQAIQKVKEGQ